MARRGTAKDGAAAPRPAKRKAVKPAVIGDEAVLWRVSSAIGPGTQLRRPRANGFTLAKRARFFEHLARTANIRASCEAAGVTEQAVWQWRRRDAAFRHAWEQALAQGYADLEIRLLAKAMFGTTSETESETDSGGAKRTRTRRDAPGLGIQLIKLHQAKVAAIKAQRALAAPLPRRSTEEIIAELRPRLIARIEAQQSAAEAADAASEG